MVGPGSDSPNLEAKTCIMVNCIESIQHNLVDLDTASKMWDYLAKQYDSSDPAERIEVFNTWKHIDLDSKDVQKFCNDYQLALRRFDTFGIKICKEAHVYTFIDLVKPYYSTWSAIKTDALKKITGITRDSAPHALVPNVGDLITDLLDHNASEKRSDNRINFTRHGGSGGRNQQPQQNQQNTSGGGNSSTSDGNKSECSYCKAKGHGEAVGRSTATLRITPCTARSTPTLKTTKKR
jgi:hypothetical protein